MMLKAQVNENFLNSLLLNINRSFHGITSSQHPFNNPKACTRRELQLRPLFDKCMIYNFNPMPRSRAIATLISKHSKVLTPIPPQYLFPRSKHFKHNYSQDNVISGLPKNPLSFASSSPITHPNNQNLNFSMQLKFRD